MAMNPKLIVEQKLTVFVNRYSVFAVGTDGQKGELLAFAQQKRAAIKEKIIFYKDEQKQEIAFTMRAEKVFDVHGRYLVEDATGKHVGSLKKVFGQSLLVSTWNILDTGDKVLLKIAESNKALAIFRRICGLVPYVGDLLELFMAFLVKYHFDFIDVSTGLPIGKYYKTAMFHDHYRLDMQDAAYEQYDWRVLAAMTVGLDALQSR
jgi:hypothetical protein